MEPPALVPVVTQRVAEEDVLRVVRCHQHVRLADGEGLRVDLLAVELDPDFRVQRLHLFLGDRQHAAGPAGRVVDGADDAGLRQRIGVVAEQERDDQADDLARGEVLAPVSFEISEKRRIRSSNW